MTPPTPPTTTAQRRKILFVELWGLGDLTFSTPVLDAATRQQPEPEVWLLAKRYAHELLHPSFPSLRFVPCDAPWTAYLGKYDLRKWDWAELGTLIRRLRAERFDVAVSRRNDPRDHFFMWLIGARERYGCPWRGSEIFLTHPIPRKKVRQHKVEDWRDIGTAMGLPGMDEAQPRLRHGEYRSPRVEEMFARIGGGRGGGGAPVICLHAGARIAVRRWPEEYFAHIVQQLRKHFHFHLLLIPDPDGYGAGLEPLADSCLQSLSVRELVDVLGRCDLLLCNDSGPSHIAACCGRPAIVIFGPSDPDWFRPWGDIHRVIIRDICPWRPCFDYCKFPEPHCMTKLLPEIVWPDIHRHIVTLMSGRVLPETLLKPLPAAFAKQAPLVSP